MKLRQLAQTFTLYLTQVLGDVTFPAADVQSERERPEERGGRASVQKVRGASLNDEATPPALSLHSSLV